MVEEDFKLKLWVPSTMTTPIIEKAHNSPITSHGGIIKTIERVNRFYYWPIMTSPVKLFVKNCQICRETKACNKNLRPEIGQEVITDRPFQKSYIDFLGKYPRSKSGNAYIFIVVDHFTKFTFLKAMRDATTINVIKFLLSGIFHYKIKHIKTAVYSPQSNASEGVNQSVIAAIRAYLNDDHRDLDLYLSEIECALRTSVHSATGVTPFFSLFGYHMFSCGSDYKLSRRLMSMSDHQIKDLERPDKFELIREKVKSKMHEVYEKSSARYNKRAQIVKFVPGQEVYRRNTVLSDFAKDRNAKFCKKFLKYRIMKLVGNNMYEL